MEKSKLLNMIDREKVNEYGNIDEAQFVYNQVIELAVENNYPDVVVLCEYYIGNTLINGGRMFESIKIFNEIYNKLLGMENDLLEKNYVLLSLGRVYFSLREYEASLKYYLTALRVTDKKDIKFRSKLYLNIGDIYRRLGDHKETKEYLDKILIHEEEIDRDLLCMVYTNYSEILIEKNMEHGKAIDYIEKSDRISMEINDIMGLAYNRKLIGDLYLSQGEYEKAEANLNKSIEIYISTKERQYIFETYESYIKLLKIQQRHDELEVFMNEIFDDTIKYNQKYFELFLYKEYCDLYSVTSSYDKQLLYYDKYLKLQDELDKKNIKRKLENVIDQFDLINAQHEKEIIKIKNEELKEKTNNLYQTNIIFEKAMAIISSISSVSSIYEINQNINNRLNTIMDCYAFGISIFDNQSNILRCYGYIENGNIIPNFEVDINDKNSFSAYSIRNRTDIYIREGSYEERKKYTELESTNIYGGKMKTLVFKLLYFQDKVIGVVTMQSKRENAYSETHLRIFDFVVPYIASSVNNYIVSYELREEILEKEKIQAELMEANNKLYNLSTTDQMTKLKNRHSLNEDLIKLKDIGTFNNETSGFIMIDIDYFKEFNDTYGHIKGDICIGCVGELIRKISEKYSGEGYRYGGDEFLMVFADVCDENTIREIGEEIRMGVEELNIPNLHSSISNYVTVSIGIAIFNHEKNINQSEMIAKVDSALYKSKRLGRNQVK